MKNYDSRNVAEALVNTLYTEREMHKAADPNSKMSKRYDEVLKTIQEKGYENKKRDVIIINLGNGRLLRRQVLHELESD